MKTHEITISIPFSYTSKADSPEAAIKEAVGFVQNYLEAIPFTDLYMNINISPQPTS